MNYEKEYKKLRAKVEIVTNIASGIGLAVFWAGIIVYALVK